MIYKFKENRVRRAYIGGAIIDSFKNKNNTQNGRYPEEWIASTVKAFNPDCIVENEGLSICENGELFKDIIEQNPREILGDEQYLKLPRLNTVNNNRACNFKHISAQT